jgi:hypothetical protein
VVSLPVGLRLDGGFGVFACGVGGAKKAFGRFGAFQAWQTAGLKAKYKLLMWLWGLFACGVGGAKKAFGAFGGWLWCLCLRSWDAIVAVGSDERAKFHTSGGPRRRPCLGKGRGRRILYMINYIIFYI